GEQLLTTGDLVRGGILDQHLHLDVEQASGVVGPLEVAADPEQRLGDTAEHHTSSSGVTGAMVWVEVSGSSSSSASSIGSVGRANTQVSFDPPPRLEFTISSPSGSATRVSPPGSTHTSSPSLT